MLDISGTQRLYGSESRLIRLVNGNIQKMGFRVRIATAATFGCAWGVSRYGKHELSCVPSGCEREAMSQLPAAALRVDEATVRGLSEIGMTHAGHVFALSRAALAARFDPILVHRMLQALGKAEERIESVRPVPPARIDLVFDGPTDHWESVEAAAQRVLEQLVAELARREHGVRRLDVELLRPHAPSSMLQINLSRASRSMKHLWSLLRPRLETIDLGEGVEGVTLTATSTARLRHQQLSSVKLGMDDDRSSKAAFGELVDALVGRLGADNVVRIEPVESHLPERAFRERSIMEASSRATVDVTPADRPTVLYPKPEPVEVMAVTPDGPIINLAWRGQRWNVITCSLPERLGSEWWRWQPPPTEAHEALKKGTRPCARRSPRLSSPPPPDRDYFAVQTDEGRWLWMCRQVGTTRWFVHGEWS